MAPLRKICQAYNRLISCKNEDVPASAFFSICSKITGELPMRQALDFEKIFIG